ncbi:glycosyltransferase family 2 protein [Clostridium sp.]|uniref:glycosyltransferase family 2 protein n=1 Tax=Clostridium sp. TaxID=1506 RepID=UPI0032173737
MVKITICTPTYNRCDLLTNLYNSILKQKFNEFEWIIIDDGSTDNTKEIVENFIKEKKINITYCIKENGGKHTAVNRGLDIASGELFFIIDSDDTIKEDALETIWEYWKEIRLDESYVGVAGLKAHTNGNLVGTSFDGKYIDATVINFRYKKKIFGDKCEVYKTDVLRQYKFPIFQKEKFTTEALVWNRLSAKGYKIRWFNEVIYYCEYLENGLTGNYDRLMVDNWNATRMYYNELARSKEMTYIKKVISVYPYFLKYCIKKYGLIKAFYKEKHTISLIASIPFYIVRKIKKVI